MQVYTNLETHWDSTVSGGLVMSDTAGKDYLWRLYLSYSHSHTVSHTLIPFQLNSAAHSMYVPGFKRDCLQLATQLTTSPLQPHVEA